MIAGQTHLVLIIDRSGSMNKVKTDAIGGFNSFLETQKAVPGDVVVTLVLFDHEILKIYEKLPLDQAYPLTDKTFVPRGQTALLDAIGTTLKEVTADLDTNPSCPERTLVVVLTDGQENHSRIKKEEVKKLIEDMTARGNFEIMYLSADINAFADAQSYGIPINATMGYQSTSQGTQDAYIFMADSAIQYRETGTTQLPRRTCGTVQPPENN